MDVIKDKALVTGVPEGYDAVVLTRNVFEALPGPLHLHIARDGKRMMELAETINFFSSSIEIITFPAWDCLPYDRVSPKRDVVASRVDSLTRLANRQAPSFKKVIVISTVNAILQRIPTPDFFDQLTREIRAGSQIDIEEFSRFLGECGFDRTATVREPGEYSVRGGIIDIYPPGELLPVRIDLFGDSVEKIRKFDPISQLTTGQLEKTLINTSNEVILNANSISQFRGAYRETFGSVADDPLYTSVSEGRKQIGMEHWLPLFHGNLATLFDYLPSTSISLDYEVEPALDARWALINDYHDARITFAKNEDIKKTRERQTYRPLSPEKLYLTSKELGDIFSNFKVSQFFPFAAPDKSFSSSYSQIISGKASRSPNFSANRIPVSNDRAVVGGEINPVFKGLKDRLYLEKEKGNRCIITALTKGSRVRLEQILKDNKISNLQSVSDWNGVTNIAGDEVALAVLPTEHGFTSDGLFLVSEQDILGERIVQPQKRRRSAEDFIKNISEISGGDFVVHVEHGIGRYDGLETINVAGAPHDCLRLSYSGEDRLFVPVENLEVLSRYGSGENTASLDRLGGAAWQARKARMKARLRDIAGSLIKVAAERTLRPATKLDVSDAIYHEFAAAFPYTETEDQAEAIAETLKDLRSGTAMDRLVCGDVGFGKTEIALRAAFSTVMSGRQVAIVVPTTLLCRQHFSTFIERFKDVPVRIEQLSRLVGGKPSHDIRQGLANGEVDIVIGTHALLSPNITFKNLELLIVDEEQHFGVTHKERLKKLKVGVHILTLTATPIPRTLQMALTGVKEMSLIGTPPVDRLAVRTFILPFDEVMIKEAIMREHFRGGQVFYVCPRITNLEELAHQLCGLVPDVKIGVAHGKMGARALEDVMSDFYEGELDLLLSTQIVESGLDIPRANTMIIHRADMFGLAQLYQLRGRIGRSKLRAYCYLTIPTDSKLTSAANKRLEVMQSLDTLGAGFSLASHDLDIRGAGNLLGEEQSGHIREVGIELYQHMLEEAVAAAKGGEDVDTRDWSPAINVGIPVLIPEIYVSDLSVRLGLYRRIAELKNKVDSEAFAAELIDRFGTLPGEVENLLKIVNIKQNCRGAGIQKIDAGPKGATLRFRENNFSNPAGLVEFISKNEGSIQLKPDHSLVIRQEWARPFERLKGVQNLALNLAQIARKANKSIGEVNEG